MNFTWGPPNPSVLNFSDCSKPILLWKFYEATPWFYPSLDRELPNESREGLDPLLALLDGLQDYLRTNNLAQPPRAELWYWLQNFDVARTIMRLIDRKCSRDMCAHMGWEGNSDIAGLGMLVTYVIQAILISLYIPILLAVRFDKMPEKLRRKPWISKSLLAVQHSTSTFLNASFIFCVAMLFASLISFGRLASESVRNFTRSTWALTLLLPFSSVLPVVMLNLAASSMLRRVRSRIILWIMVMALIITVLTLSAVLAFNDWGRSPINSWEAWESHCLNLKSIFGMIIFGWSLGLALTLTIGSYLVRAITSYTRYGPKKPSRCFSPSIQLISILLAFCVMWASLGWFINFHIQSLKASGEDNKDGEWSFGQILAQVTWVPVVVEFAYIWWEQPEEALSGRLMAPYEAVKVFQNNKVDGM